MWKRCTRGSILSEFYLLPSALILMQMIVIAVGEWCHICVIIAFVVTIIVTLLDETKAR